MQQFCSFRCNFFIAGIVSGSFGLQENVICEAACAMHSFHAEFHCSEVLMV